MVKLQSLEKEREENRIDHRYLDTLMFKHNRSQFLFKDTHQILGPSYHDNSFDVQKEFAKQCLKQNDAIPISSLIIQDQFREDLYSLMNVHLTPE